MPRMTITLVFIFLINLISMSGFAATKAGTRITNQANASYFDTGTGQIFRILSNYSTFYVGKKLAVDQDRDQQINAAAGQLVYFPHTIVNTGNQPDSYQLSAENTSNDNGDLSNIQIYIDDNGDGLVNPGEQLISGTDILKPGEQVQIVVAGFVPQNSDNGDQYTVEVTTESTTDPGVQDIDMNTVTTTDGAVLRINRVTDVDCAIPMGLGDRSQHIVNYTNTGNQSPVERNIIVDGAPLSGVLIQEDIPDYMSLLKAPAFYSEPAVGILLVGNPLGSWSSYDQWNGLDTINKLAVLMPANSIKSNQSGKFSYTYQVSSLPLEQTSIQMMTQADFDNDGVNDVESNISCNTIEADDRIIKERPDLVLSGTVFDGGNLLGVPGATVDLMNAGTIVASIGNTPVATTVSQADGYYEFTNIAAGEYYLKTTPPAGYEMSRHEPTYFTTYKVLEPSYGLEGYSAENDIGNDGIKDGIFGLDPALDSELLDIPLDRIGIRGQIAIEKKASTDSATIGEPVAYTVTINNITGQDLYHAHIEDVLPPGFKYLNSTAKVNGVATSNEPTNTYNTDTGRNTLVFRIGDFPAGSKKELTYIAQISARATDSDGINTAYAYGDTITDIRINSPEASVKVDVVMNGVLSDRAIIFGRVAVARGCEIGPDRAVNDAGFPLAGVRLYMEDGTYVITDPNGQYSLYGLQPGMHVLKVDNHSLPEGVQLTLTERAQAGDPDSRFVDLTPGDFYRADFTAACPEAQPEVVTQCIEPPPPIVKKPVVKRPVIAKRPVLKPAKKLPPKKPLIAKKPVVRKPTPVVRKPIVIAKKPRPVLPPPMRKVRQCVDQPYNKKISKMVTRTIKDVVKPVYFESGKAIIPTEYAAKLRQLVNMTQDKQNVRFKMIGHTDNQRLKASTKRKFGTNKKLSEARASQVAQHVLNALGIKTRISIAGYGDTRPVASNKTKAGMAKNRRVELVMLYDEPEVTIQRSSKQVCSIKHIAPEGKLANTINSLSAAGVSGAAGKVNGSAGQASANIASKVKRTRQRKAVRQIKRRSPQKKRVLSITQPTVSTGKRVLSVKQPTVSTGVGIAGAKAAPVLSTAKPTASTMQKTVTKRGKKICTTKVLPATSPVIQNILARSKQYQSGWQKETDSLDLANANNLKNLAQMAGKDGDISNGLVEAYNRQAKRQQQEFASQQAAKDTAANKPKAPSMPDSKVVVKTITREQGKAGTWLWPQGDTSLDGRFMAIVRAGVQPTLYVNGKAVSNKHLGEQIENRSAKAQVMAWYGVKLEEGENKLTVKAKGPFGNERTLAEKVFKRPSAGVAMRMSTKDVLVADGGRSMIPVDIEILDRNGYPAKGTYFLTLENSDGRWAEPDIQDKVPGHQVKVTNGKRTVHLRSSAQSGTIKLRASTDKLLSEADVSQIAELRPLVAVGLLDVRAHKGYSDGYENLGLIQLDKDSEDITLNGRAALFMKGEIRGNMHLTLSYDSEKDKDAELLRDINPAEYYSVYGDSSKRGYEAQSRSPLYAKLEKDRHSLMWGDYITDNETSGADIAISRRTLTGLNGIYDDGVNRLQMFAAQPDNMRSAEEIAGNGTAMQYQLQNAPIVKNSEVVEIITRDNDNSGLIIASEQLTRFRDYSIDDYTGYLTFHRVIPSLDDELNPVSIRVSYDRTEEGESYLVAGVRAMRRITDNLNVGVNYTRDEHSTAIASSTQGHQIVGAYAEFKDELTELQLGVARMTHNNGTPDGDAIRIKASHKWAPGSSTELLATQADSGYDNVSSGVIKNRREIKLSQKQRFSKDIEGKLELSHSEPLDGDDTRQSVEISATTKLGDWKVKGGARHIRQNTATTEERINTAIVGVERNIELFERRGKIKAEYERELGDAARQRFSIGADMQLTDKTKAYVRYERADRLAAGTLAGAVDTNDTLVAGVKSQILPSTEMYSEYRIEGGISGEDVVAANGVKATLHLEDNFVITPSLEFLNYFEDSTKSDSVAVSVGIRDTRDSDSKRLLRAEARFSDDEKFFGVNGTVVQKISDDWTYMVREEMRFSRYEDNRGDELQNTLTIAAAHRPKPVADRDSNTNDSYNDNYNALYAYKWDVDTAANKDTHILSTHQHYRINESWNVSGRLAAKKQTLLSGGSSYDSDAVMADVRYTWDVTDRLSLDLHGGMLSTNGFSENNYSVGTGINFNVIDNLQIGAGYNFSGFMDEDLDPSGHNAKGMYFGLQFKLDEDMFDWLGAERPSPRSQYKTTTDNN